eukprot:c41738_g1_i1 orf=111-266(+)
MHLLEKLMNSYYKMQFYFICTAQGIHKKFYTYSHYNPHLADYSDIMNFCRG